MNSIFEHLQVTLMTRTLIFDTHVAQYGIVIFNQSINIIAVSICIADS